MSQAKRYVIVGVGGRSDMYRRYLADPKAAHGAKLVGFCDINPGRMALANAELGEKFGHPPVAEAGIDDFEAMIREQKADGVIVTSMDRTHDEFICRAMEAGCDVITEKPMTTDERKCRKILDVQRRTGRNLRVTFNYRYAPRNSKVKELLSQGVIGQVYSVHFEWFLNTKHGADYFRRWHRDKRNSGGLMVHKSTHHFDLVNWWLDSLPETVMAMGDLRFYGRANAEARGVREFYQRATGNPVAEKDPFALPMAEGTGLAKMYLDQEKYDGYQRDQSVFGDGISIEDDVGVLVRYANQATMSYHLTAYSPCEGYRVVFNGSKGRLEYEVMEKAYVSGEEGDHNALRNVQGAAPEPVREPNLILVRPMWGKPFQVELPETNEGGHGGGDIRMLNDIFIGGEADPLGRAAGHIDGAASILTGVAANRSMATGLPVQIRDLGVF
ncbi:MAG: Gfo/Idh/MocA family oxidoreductase [Verrucomicrobia bacterium]|nr:Gfo/Idh/MocA family oxidoreductase [Verrucomicrobiota bacterium]MCH8527799.1 Gfo/Idh/MocA family oxidoreductase [Kiritimatiellia bacterium]